MSTPRFSSLLLCLALFFSACSGSNDQTSSQLISTLNAQKKSDPIFLEGLSATSINLPEEKFGPENLFDQNNSTYWQPMPEAGPDEGIQLLFSEPIYIESIYLQNPSQENFYKIRRISLYINGNDFGEREISHRISVGELTKSLFIKLYDFDGVVTSQPLYSANYGKVGLSEISFYDKSNKEIIILPPLKVSGKITPSSALSPQEAYQADFLFDSRLDFGWADGNSEKTGIGEFLDIHTPEAITITKLKIWNGYQRSNSHYKSNERIKTFTFGSGASSATYTLPDSPSAQEIQLKTPLTATDFKLSVTDIYPGSKYKDLVISELRFFDGKNWFILSSGKLEKDKQELLKKVQNTLLGEILDRRFYQDKPHNDNSDLSSVQSFILRSNGSFVLWKFSYNEASSSNDTEEVVADGNWQILDDTKTKSKIQIFGRLYQLKKFESTGYNPYAGENAKKSQTESFKIFQDTLDISTNTLSSQRKLFVPFQYKTSE